MLLLITQPKYLYSFVLSFIVTYSTVYPILDTAPNIEPVVDTVVTYPVPEPLPLTHVSLPSLPNVTLLDLTDYRQFVSPKGQGKYHYFTELFDQVQSATGVSHRLLARFVTLESSFYTNASPGGSNTAKGLFQFTDDTWKETVSKFGHQFNIDHTTSVWDPRANTLMAAMRIKDAQSLLTRTFPDRTITETDIYLTHFLGRTGAIRFLKADADRIAAHHMRAAAKRNKGIFYARRKALTYDEIYTLIANRFDAKAIEFGLV